MPQGNFCQVCDDINKNMQVTGNIHLIPKWWLSQMIWVELHENEASRAKLRCLQMLI